MWVYYVNMLHNVEQQGVSVGQYEEVKAKALSLAASSGVRFAESTYDVDFMLYRDQPHRHDFADWEYELRGEYDIGDESCQLLLRDLAEIASFE